MAMGTRRKRRRQESLWIPVAELPSTAAHPFYQRLNGLLDDAGFDAFVEEACRAFYAVHDGATEPGPGDLLPVVVDWVLRGFGFGARDRVARG